MYIGYLQNEDLKHIAAEEMQKVEECVQKKRQWMDEQLQKLANLAKYTNPPVTVSQIETETKVSPGTLNMIE